MSHQPFETWLFEEEALEEREALALRQHLAECAACRSLGEAWEEMSGLLGSSAVAAPAPGFADRWRGRLVEDRERRHRLQAWAVLGFTAAAGVAAAAGMAIEALTLLDSPARLALRIFEAISVFAAQVFVIREAILGVAERLPSFFASSWPLVSLAALAVLGALWAVSIYRYAIQGARK
jgi:predicted anti-sigma-YlaC factor YlaD